MLETVVPRNPEAHVMLVKGKRKGQVSCYRNDVCTFDLQRLEDSTQTPV